MVYIYYMKKSRHSISDDYGNNQSSGKIKSIVNKLLNKDLIADYEVLNELRRQNLDEQILNEAFIAYKRKLHEIY